MLLFDRLRGVVQSCSNVIERQMRIVLKDLFIGPSVRQLWTRSVKKCYAGTLHVRFGGAAADLQRHMLVTDLRSGG